MLRTRKCIAAMELIDRYLQLVAQLDEEIDRLSRYHGPQLRCLPGCSSCCGSLTVLPIEAEAIRWACQALAPNEQRLTRQMAGNGGCPFLHRQRCLIYGNRPVICRTHGLPIAYADQEREVLEVSACHLNFPADYHFDRDGLLFLDPYNEQLVLLSSCLGGGAPLQSLERISVARLVPAAAD